MYTIFVKDIDNVVLWELPYQSFSFTEELNKGKDARFSFDFETIKVLADTYNTTTDNIFGGGFREIWIEKSGIKIYYGVITDFDLAGDRETDAVSVSVASVGFFNVFGKRRTNNKRVFSGTDAGTIAWTLINESQTSDNPYSTLGVTMGIITASVNRDRTFRFASVKDEIVQMSNENLSNGFDFDIDNSKVFNVYYPQRGSARADIVFDAASILNWSRNRPSVLSLTNKIYVLGEGINDDILYSTRISAATYRDVFGTLEDVLSKRDVIESATLDAAGDRFLLESQSPRETFTISHVDDVPDIKNYSVGDSVRVTIQKLGFSDQYKRVTRRAVACDGEDLAIVTLTLK
jgi:hypothetical protein